MAWRTSGRLVTIQASQAGTHETGSDARSRWSTGWGSSSSCSSVTEAPIGKARARSSVVVITARYRSAALLDLRYPVSMVLLRPCARHRAARHALQRRPGRGVDRPHVRMRGNDNRHGPGGEAVHSSQRAERAKRRDVPRELAGAGHVQDAEHEGEQAAVHLLAAVEA